MSERDLMEQLAKWLPCLVWAAVLASFPLSPAPAGEHYGWQALDAEAADRLDERFAPPPGFLRAPSAHGSYAAFLRGLPLKPAGSWVMLYNGTPKFWSHPEAAVIAMDAGTRDLQQCADAVMRLRAEWLFSVGRFADIHFNATSGDRLAYSRWRQGERPAVSGSAIRWQSQKPADASYASFRRYLDTVFTYAGTASLVKELQPVAMADIQIGDVVIVGGHPGHAILVVDLATDPKSGEKRFLLGQSFMPAQEFHVLKNPSTTDGSPWYAMPRNGVLETPEWTFATTDLMRFP